MCYDKAYLTKKLELYAKRYGDTVEEVQFIKEQISSFKTGPVYHTSGFDHPLVPVMTNGSKEIRLYSWGLIPHWVKSAGEAVAISNSTINARAETMFEKPAFRESARSQRCLVLADGFFEHHHKSGKTFPYFIQLKSDEPMTLAGLWDEWKDPASGLIKRTYAIVTTRANPLMRRIHNNPKLEDGPRMPLILPRELEGDWLRSITDKADKELIESVIQPYDESKLVNFTVGRLRGKEAIGNKPEALLPVRYTELEETQGSLF